ncbi:MAG TPA: phosphoglycerate mutase family protein [Acidobacteriota bacterium]|nr:phosphoglycerate mutase family protein [Acidobacteriota bacterium]
MKRTGMAFVWAIGCVMLLSCGPAVETNVQEPTGSATVVVIVRHAEKLDDSEDPPLSEKGRRRAELLAQILANMPVAGLYATQYLRTHETLAPLAERFQLPVHEVHSDSTPELVREILAQFRGRVVVTAGHSGSVPRILRELGAGDYPELDEKEYDRLFVAVVGSSDVTVLPLQFGMENR